MAACIEVKLLLLGESGVGKSALCYRFEYDKFKDHHKKSLVCFTSVSTNVQGKDVKISIWDLSGEEKYRNMGTSKIFESYYKNADGVLLVYDQNDLKTLEKLSGWLDDFKTVNEIAEVVVVGNKDDTTCQKTLKSCDTQSFAQEKNVPYVGLSARSGKNVEKVFRVLVQKILIAKDILPLSEDFRLLETETFVRTSVTSMSSINELQPQDKLADSDVQLELKHKLNSEESGDQEESKAAEHKPLIIKHGNLKKLPRIVVNSANCSTDVNTGRSESSRIGNKSIQADDKNDKNIKKRKYFFCCCLNC